MVLKNTDGVVFVADSQRSLLEANIESLEDLYANLEEGEKIADMPVRRTRELCELCHRRLDARPAGFAQVDVREHVTEMGGEFTDDACSQCHEPHSPI